jgi:predicted TIM-barrel fold metal-dependent hydrolase
MMQQVLEARAHEAAEEVAVTIVDTDIHPAPQSIDELLGYMAEPWRSLPEQLHSPFALVLYLPPGGPVRADSEEPGGLPAGSDPVLTEQQLFGDAGIDFGILLPQVRTHLNPEYEVALCAATNDWLADTWLSKYNAHNRWRGTISICANQPEAAAREIERWAGHPMMAQVRLNAYAGLPYGDPFYDPIYAAATRAGLPVAIHFSKGTGMSLLTPVGFLSYFFEHHALYPVTYAGHVVSLICSGTFDRFPELKYVFVEGGYAWSLPLLWRLERQWDQLKQEVHWVKRRPSDYVREHMWWTSQPIEEPERISQMTRVMEFANAGETLLFATDYPHWDYDDPTQVAKRIPEAYRERVFSENAIQLFGLPRTRPA